MTNSEASFDPSKFGRIKAGQHYHYRSVKIPVLMIDVLVRKDKILSLSRAEAKNDGNNGSVGSRRFPKNEQFAWSPGV